MSKNHHEGDEKMSETNENRLRGVCRAADSVILDVTIIKSQPLSRPDICGRAHNNGRNC